MKTPCIAILVLFWKAQFSIENFIKCLISYWIENNSSDLEIWEIHRVFFWVLRLQCVRFPVRKFTTCQLLRQLFEHASHFELNNSQRVRFWIEKKINALCFETKNFSSCQILKKCLHSKFHVLVHFYPCKRHVLHFLCYFKKHNFELKLFLRVKIRIEKNTTRQSPKWKKYYASFFEFENYNAPDFDLKSFQRVGFYINF